MASLPAPPGLGSARVWLTLAWVLCGCGRLDGEQTPDAATYEVGDRAVSPQRCPVRHMAGPVDLPRHIIVLVGDGMGPQQVITGRAHAGGALRMDELPAHGRLGTDSWSTRRAKGAPPTDSAAAATAFATGRLANNGQIGLSSKGQPATTVLDIAQRRGYATGLATTSYLYDATPMAFAVHVESRALYDDIIAQLLARPLVDFVLGGAAGLDGGAYLEWRTMALAAGYVLVADAPQLQAQGGEQPVLGMFAAQRDDPPTDIPWVTTPAHRRGRGETDPSLSQMATWLLDALATRAGEDGWFALIEDEHPDALGHLALSYPEVAQANIAGQVVYFDEAVGAAIDWVHGHSSFDETLLVVLADHETGAYRHDPSAAGGGVFSTDLHTRTPVDLFAAGPGAEHIGRLCHLVDVFALLTGRAAEL